MKTTRIVRLLAFLAAFIASTAGIANAQSGAGSITGLVTDETGGAMPGVTVTATNQATTVDYTAQSNEAGNYTIEGVPVGTYVVKAVISGFRTSTTPVFALEARQIARLDFKLSVGALQETVQVVGSSPILQTETPTVGEVISGSTASSLPLNGRNIGQLALLLTGTTTYNPRGFTNIGSINMNRPFVNGNREQTNNFTVDGSDNNDEDINVRRQGFVALVPQSAESVAESTSWRRSSTTCAKRETRNSSTRCSTPFCRWIWMCLVMRLSTF